MMVVCAMTTTNASILWLDILVVGRHVAFYCRIIWREQRYTCNSLYLSLNFLLHAVQYVLRNLPSTLPLAKYPMRDPQLSHFNNVTQLVWYHLSPTDMPLLDSAIFNPQTEQLLLADIKANGTFFSIKNYASASPCKLSVVMAFTLGTAYNKTIKLNKIPQAASSYFLKG